MYPQAYLHIHKHTYTHAPTGIQLWMRECHRLDFLESDTEGGLGVQDILRDPYLWREDRESMGRREKMQGSEALANQQGALKQVPSHRVV